MKFVVGDAHQLMVVGRVLDLLSERHGLARMTIDAATTRLHMIQDVFFAIARALDWNAMAQHFVESLFRRKGYEWPRPGEAVPIQDMAECNDLDVTLLRRDFRQWLTAEVMRDTEIRSWVSPHRFSSGSMVSCVASERSGRPLSPPGLPATMGALCCARCVGG